VEEDDTMPLTAPISYDGRAPGSRSITFTIGGVAPDLTAYTARMAVWKNGVSTTSAPLFTLANGSGITLGTGGAIAIDMAAFETQVAALAPNDALFHYVLDVRDGTNPRVFVSSGPVARGQP